MSVHVPAVVSQKSVVSIDLLYLSRTMLVCVQSVFDKHLMVKRRKYINNKKKNARNRRRRSSIEIRAIQR